MRHDPSAAHGSAIYRAPMRARDRDVAPGLGARHGVEHGLVGIGDELAEPPTTVEQAAAAAAREHGAKAGRMLRRLAELPEGTFVWTRVPEGTYFLGRIAGPWRYDVSSAASAVGIHHVRPTSWLDRPIGEDDVPVAVAATFARGGRNLQRIHDGPAEARTAELWSTFAD